MSWIQKLYETYDNCNGSIGDPNDIQPLLPICHTPQNAHIEITIDGAGDFQKANVVTGNHSTIIPCTEGSAGKSGRKPVCHPLCDKLQYVAGDFVQYGGEVTSGFAASPEQPFNDYVNLLSNWCSPPFAHPKAQAILTYVQKMNMISDLINSQILHTGLDHKLLKEWNKDKKDAPLIFKQLPGNSWQTDALVRWIVQIPGDPQEYVWSDRSLWASWIKYYLSTKKTTDRCYVTGDNLPKTEQHPAKIRNNADKAKIISSNDISGFTFRGRFANADQACTVGFEVTQKAHNALRWLIAKQGYKRGDQAIVAWAVSGIKIPDPMLDTLGLFDEERLEISSPNTTAQHFGNNLSRLIAGYSSKLGPTDGIVVMGIDSATPGRLAVTYYRELTGSEFLARVQGWHESCAWWQDYGKDKETKSSIRFVGAPSPGDIAWAAYGKRIDDKLLKATVERVLPCIVDGLPLPRDIVESAVRHVCNRISMEPWEWEKSLGITCSIYKKYHKERSYDMALEEDRRTRDYLYGRLLALADGLEGWSLKESGEKRETSAARLMQRFASHPYSTWKSIELALLPYKTRLGGKARKYNDLITAVHDLFDREDYTSDKPLNGEFLLGYHCQRKALFKAVKVQESDEQIEEQDEN